MSVFHRFVLNRQHPLALPVLTYPGGQLTGKRVRDLVNDAQAQFEAQAALHRRFPLAAALSPMDLSVEAEAFGAELMISDDDPPTVTGRPATTADAVRSLQVPKPGAKRTAVYLETVRLLARQMPGNPPVLAGMIGPFSLAGRLYGVSESLELAIEDPDLLHLLLEKSTAFLQAYALAFKQAGAAGVVMAEPTAGLLSPRMLGTFSSPYVKQILEAAEDDTFTVIYHNCAAKPMHLPFILQTGATALHFGPPMDLQAALSQVGPNILVAGNLDPSGVFVQGRPDDVFAAAKNLLDKLAGRKNFILSSGCDIPARASLANLDAFFRALET